MMRAPSFAYRAPRSVAEVVEILAGEGPQARLLAGGTDLVPNLKRRQQVPVTLVALRRVEALKEVTSGGGFLTLGAGLTLSQVVGHRDLSPGQRALEVAASKVATPHIRNMGTIGGNLCLDTRCNYYNQNYEWRQAIDFCKKAPGPEGTAKTEVTTGICWVAPSSPRCWAVSSTDTAPALVALGAEVTLVSTQGERRIPLSELYFDDGMAYLTKRPDELLTAVHVPILGEGWKSTYWKLRRRGSFDFPVLSVAAAIKFGPQGVVLEARMTLGAVQSYPVSVPTDALLGQPLSDEVIATFAAAASRPARPLDNTDYNLSWRKKVCTAYIAGALKELRGDSPEQLGVLARTAARLPVLS
ncbi:MAG: FAD binding domain-containing protein [Planctomycetes bacterium]|nr:FAD binding domain-containing protein [Planctomycetota bacterium]